MKIMDFKAKLQESLKGGYLSIRDGSNKEIAFLSILSEDDLNNTEFIIKSTEWRKRFAGCFLTVFEPNPERTRSWMEKSLLPDPDRVLCKIYTTDMNLAGHVGAINHGSYIEYDYFIRGVKVDIRNFSLIVGTRFLQWVCEVSGIDMIRAVVRSDNQKIIDFVGRMGFRFGAKHPLGKKYLDRDEYALIVDESLTGAELYLIDIDITAGELALP